MSRPAPYSMSGPVLPLPDWFMAVSLVPLSLLLSLGLTGLAIRYACRLGIMDIPNDRSSHARPTPRGGGIAIVASFLAGTTALWGLGSIKGDFALALALPGLLVASIGFADDVRSLGVVPRLAVQVLSAGLALVLLGIPMAGAPAVTAAAMLAVGGFGLVWALNLFNFMDGIDGIAASEAAFILVAAAAFLVGPAPGAAMVAWLLAAACLGFLAWNRPPARIFMGDCGSGFLGLTIGTMAIGTSGVIPLQAWAILGGAFLVDATVTLLIRLARGERPLQPHRSHAYQHLARRWGSHQKVVLCVWGINLLWLLPWAWVATASPGTANIALTVALAPLCALAVRIGAGRLDTQAR